MRIAQVTHSYKPITGGADVYADMLRRICEDAGHEVTVYQRPVDGIDDPQVRIIRSALRSALGPRGEFWTVPFGLPALKRELLEQDALIVHYPNHHRMVEWHPKTVLLSHGVFWDDKPGALRSNFKRGLARRAYQKANMVVANDTFFLREVGQDVQPGAEPFSEVRPGRFFIPNCVDTGLFSRVEPDPRLTDWPVILVPRNLYRNRGVHLAIIAFGQLRGKLDKEVRLAIVGADSQPDYADCCRGMVAEGLGHRVLFLGPVPWKDMPAIYSASDMCLIPTICGEGTSLSALEAMSTGVATVTTNVAGLADLPSVQCEPTPEALAQAMLQTWERREDIARDQQQTVREVYNLENWTKAWLAIIDRLGQATYPVSVAPSS